MALMHIQRTQRRAYWPLAGCLLVALSCLAITTVAALLLLPALPGLALRIAGFQPQGSTADFFEAQSPAPAIIANRAAPPVQAVLDLGIYGREPLSGIGYAYALETGTDASGAPVADGTRYALQAIHIDDQTLTLVLR
jgi:hypothetical protein